VNMQRKNTLYCMQIFKFINMNVPCVGDSLMKAKFSKKLIMTAFFKIPVPVLRILKLDKL
jgi:hypothetical protein